MTWSAKVSIKIDAKRHPSQSEFNIVVETTRRWFRLFACYGIPPGSRIGIWRTDTGSVHGWNLRIGRRYRGPCLTFLAHTRPADRNVIGS